LPLLDELRASSPCSREVILVVDDEPVVRNIVRALLQAEGYFVLAACDGKEALELSRSFSGTIHALVSDIQMPHLTGVELRETILRERPDIKVLLISGQMDSPLDGIPFLAKPFQPAALKKRLRHLLDSEERGSPGGGGVA
jgi:CheY-like chemotaxis protein